MTPSFECDAAAFGTRSYGTVYGRVSLVMVTLSMMTVFAIGSVYDRTGSYDVAFWIFGGLIGLACFLVSAVRLGTSEGSAPDALPGPARA